MVVAVVEPQQNRVVDSTLVEQELAQPASDTTVVVRLTRLALEPAAVEVAARVPSDNLVAAQRVVTVAPVAPATSRVPLSTTAAAVEVAEPPQGWANTAVEMGRQRLLEIMASTTLAVVQARQQLAAVKQQVETA
jgi:hypothetical protein